MSRVTKWGAVAVLVATGFTFSGPAARAAERTVPIQTAYRAHRGASVGGWNHWHDCHYTPWHDRWHRR